MTLKTYTGRTFDFENIQKENIHIEDILLSLPRLNRFVGHSSRAYSVGEHLVYCALMAKEMGYSPREQFLTFIHDFTEAYVSDCPAPLKNLLPQFKEIEEKVEMAVYEHFGIEPPTEEEQMKIKTIDLTMLIVEMKYLTLHDYKAFMYDFTYNHFIDRPDFDLTRFKPTEEEVREGLELIFNELKVNYNG